jgi:YHS domain-containing protein
MKARTTAGLLFFGLSLLLSPTSKAEEKVLVNRDKDGLALQGHDPVAYFTENKPVLGSEQFTFKHRGAVYRFASAEHQKLFAADPGKYEPAFGGYCGYAASIDKLAPIDPKFFQVLDGRLMLQYNKKAYDVFNQDPTKNMKKALKNWPGLVEKNGK